MSNGVQPHNEKARGVWNAPGALYDEISRTIADAIEHAVERLAPATGEQILDLATGTGWASRSIARRCPEALVSGVDIAEQLLETARALADRERLGITYRVGDAERLPFEDAAFDAVVSTFGVMFASNPLAAASELARVVKPGGRIVLATWKDDGNVAAMFGVMKPFLPAPPSPPPPSPFAWGRPERVRELLGERFALDLEEGTNQLRYASGEHAWELWRKHYGPIRSLAERLDGAAHREFAAAMAAWHETFASPLGYEQPRTYLITRGVRSV
jgi:SAM-dependent methyltransferase